MFNMHKEEHADKIRMKLKKKVQKKFSIWGFFLIVFFFVFGAFAVKLDRSQDFRCWMKELIRSCKIIYNFMIKHKFFDKTLDLMQQINRHMGTICTTVTTFSTIITAAVIFYYSVQDNKKVGIPHRRILIYIFGAFFLPVLFVISLANVLVIDFAWCIGYKYTAYYGIVMEYIIIFHIILAILFSTSFKFSLGAICYAEHKQFTELCRYGKNKLKNVTNQKRENILHHMEQAVISSELISDKMELIERLLKIPFTGCGLIQAFHGNPKVLFLEQNMDVELIYYFYHENIYSSLVYLGKNGNKMERERLYNSIYRFLVILTETFNSCYEKADDSRQKFRQEETYLITISAFINAVQYSKVDEAEDFCINVINGIVNMDYRKEVVLYYVIYQEFLYHVQADAIKLSKIEKIGCMKSSWKQEIDLRRCLKFWDIWSSAVSLGDRNRVSYLMDAVTTMQNNLGRSVIITYINWKLGKRE